MRCLYLFAALLSAPATAAAESDAEAAATAVAGTAGEWSGQLQYRDYQTDQWQGLPMTLTIAVQPDGVTTVRTAQYDDGPQTGIVTITTVAMIDPGTATTSYAIFRKRRATDSGLSRISSFQPGADNEHWTLVTIEARKDGDQTAQVRETTTRHGAEMTVLKEVNPDNDGSDEWLPRSRTLLSATSRK